jgi:elongation factor P
MEIEDIHKNAKLLIDGTPYNVVTADFVKPGKGRAIYRLRLKNLLNSSTIDRTFHSGEKVEEAHTTNIEGQYLYKDGERYVFMNTETFEQFFVEEDLLEDKKGYLLDGIVVDLLILGEKPIDISLPTFVELKVVQSDMAMKAATISPQMKSATLQTGATIGVPAFINEGDIIKVDTRTGTYVERITRK